MLGHELRNPLAQIRNALHLMQKPVVPDSVMNWGREIIGRQIDHLTRLVDDLLNVSRIAHGKIKLGWAPALKMTIRAEGQLANERMGLASLSTHLRM